MLSSMLAITVSFIALSWVMFIALSFYQWFWGHDGKAPWKYEAPNRDVWR